MYGCETWKNLTITDLKHLEQFQHLSCKMFLRIPKRTRSGMCESILGLTRITSEIHKQKLLFLQKLTSLPSNFTAKQVFTHRLAHYMVCPHTSTGYFPDIKSILTRYDLDIFLENYYSIGDVLFYFNTVKLRNNNDRPSPTITLVHL